MKIIDILNKIANGEEPPKRIIFRDEVYEYDEQDGDYRNNDNTDAIFDYHEITSILNEEVEILETTITFKQDTRKIEKLKFDMSINFIDQFTDKINEIIDHINCR